MRLLTRCEEIYWEGVRQRQIDEATLRNVPNRVTYFAWVAVSEEFRSKGVAQVLLQQGLQLVKDQGYAHALAYATSPKSARVLRRVGFEDYGAIVYKEFEMPGGRLPFTSLDGELSVMVKRLSS